MKLKLFVAWLKSFPGGVIEMVLIEPGFSYKEARKYNYEVRKAHITGDWTWLNKEYGTPLPNKDAQQ